MSRNYSETKLRNLNYPDLEIDPVYSKDFYWNRYYDVKFDLTRALKLDFSASNIARIDEPLGRMNKEDDDYELKKDSILQEIKSFGRTTNYNHQINATYNLPLNKIPFLNWINVSTRYNASFAWEAGAILDDPDIDLGNVVSNSNSYNINGQLNISNLYNKVPYLKDLNQKYRSKASREKQASKRTREVTYERENQVLRSDYPRSYTHKLKTEKIKVNVYDQNNQLVEVETDIINENRVKIQSKTDVRGARIEIIGTKDLGESPITFIVENSVRFITGVKNINLTYTNSDGTYLPGYKPSTTIVGMQNYNGLKAPGLPFILGFQDPDFAQTAYDNGWLSTDSLLNSPFMLNHNEKFSFRATFEPFNGFRVDLTANRDYSENLTEYYTSDANGQLPGTAADRGQQINGNFSMSYLSWNTAFERIYSKGLDFESEAFLKFKNDYRKVVSKRLALEYMKNNPGEELSYDDSTGYYEGFGENSQQVMISAFMAAYGSKDPSKVSLSPFPSIISIIPNWRFSFDGLSKIDLVKRYLNSLTIGHAYRSSYNVGSYISNPYEDVDQFDLISGNLIPLLDATSVSINEQFSPLFDINMDWKNSLTTRIEFKRSRTLALSTANSQVNESNSKDIVIGAGYRFNEVQIIINQKEYKSDLNVSADLSIRDNRTVIRKLSEDSDQITAGQRIISIKTSFDYVLSDRFNLRFFFDQRINKPFVSISYPTSNTSIGFSVQFTLAQ